MNLRLLKARQTKYVAYATLYIVVVLAIVSTANVLANRYDKTYDATSNKRYSLSEQTAKIVKGLREDAKISYFDQGTRFERAKDQLDLYANLSRKVHVDYVDVDKKPQLAREAGIKSYGTTIVQITTGPRSWHQELRHNHRANWCETRGSEEYERGRHHGCIHSSPEEQCANCLLCLRERRAPD